MRSKRKKKLIAYGLLGLGILLLGIGLVAGEYASVLEKAVTICLDCIGIGWGQSPGGGNETGEKTSSLPDCCRAWL